MVSGLLSAALCSLVPELSVFQGIQNSLMSIRRHTNIHIDITWRDKVNGTRCFKTVIQYRGNWSACETVREDLIRTAFVLCGPDGDCHPRKVDNIRGFRPGCFSASTVCRIQCRVYLRPRHRRFVRRRVKPGTECRNHNPTLTHRWRGIRHGSGEWDQ
ncbi:hypothetical protein C8Q70DRAFT_412337 [Cubamyces menziesii]|nr:hypothetical protein C8Q70DRAFT_412337 [Cubamyces menziesii]